MDFKPHVASPKNINAATLGQSKRPARLVTRPTKVQYKMHWQQHTR